MKLGRRTGPSFFRRESAMKTDAIKKCIDNGSDVRDALEAQFELNDIEKDNASIRGLFNEIDCRVGHGADSNGHLEYVHAFLASILNK